MWGEAAGPDELGSSLEGHWFAQAPAVCGQPQDTKAPLPLLPSAK